MYQFNHYYRSLVDSDEFYEKKATCRKLNLERDLEFIYDIINTNIPEYKIIFNYRGEESVLNEAGEVILATIYLISTNILNKNESFNEFKIEIFSDRARNYYISFRYGKFGNMYLFGSSFKCFGRAGMKKYFEHILEWRQLFGTCLWKNPKWFCDEDVKLLQLLNSDCSIKLYNYVQNGIINGQYDYFRFGHDFHFIPMIGMRKEGIGEFKIISSKSGYGISGDKDKFTGKFYAFLTTDDFLETEKTIAFCCEGAMGLTDLLHEYPYCDNIGETYRRTEFNTSYSE